MMIIRHLPINKHCDCRLKIDWIEKNIKTCRINREYKERHEPTYCGVSISVLLPLPEGDEPEDRPLYAEFAANEEGWMYVSDWRAEHLPEVSIEEGIKAVEANVKKAIFSGLKSV